ncbi:hypothetical protein [Emticicia sp. 17c]|uniref:hypothetical protein n=1 Tax=Emticicia sp. 17c TaxID=3127704 RepID=UPI00301B91E8
MENFDENIENEYRKRFQDFEEIPDDLLWKNIQARISPEKQRPIIIWWNTMRKPAGIAAGILLGLLVGAYVFVSNLDSKNDTLTHNVGGQVTASSSNNSTNVKEHSKEVGIANGKTKTPDNTSAQGQGDEPKNVPDAHSSSNKALHFNDTKTPKGIADDLVSDKLKPEKTSINIVAVTPAASGSQQQASDSGIANNAAKQENSKQIPELPTANAEQLAINTIEADNINNIKGLSQENTSVILKKDTLGQNIAFLKIKEIGLPINEKTLEAPTLALTEEPQVPEREKLVFIPPTEIFVNVTSTLSYYMFSPNKGDAVLVNNFSGASQRLGFAGQLGFVYPLGKKLDLRTGFSYFTGKSRISYGVIDEQQKSVTLINSNSIQVTPNEQKQTENQNWQYIELQSDVLYKTYAMQAISLGMKAGFQMSDVKTPLLQARLGYRLSKAIANHWALWLEPTVSVSLSSHHSLGDLFMYRTTGFGLNMGVSLLR